MYRYHFATDHLMNVLFKLGIQSAGMFVEEYAEVMEDNKDYTCCEDCG